MVVLFMEKGQSVANRYLLLRQLGRGGFSEVWLAEDQVTHVEVAIKVYAPGTGLDNAGISMFTQEFSLVFDMNHTNLLHPTYFDCWERMPYLIMPLCKNGSAFKYLTPGNNISEEEAWKLLRDVAEGLAYLHGKNPPVIHQDIKPDNILISDEGIYMITDFGISSRVRSTLRKSQAMKSSGGTLAYMGPERFSQNPTPIMASDVWSLGAMMFELLTGQPPFGEHGGLLQKSGADMPLINADYSQPLKDIIYKCLATNTWDRPTAKQAGEYASLHLMGIDTSELLESIGKPLVEAEPEPEPQSEEEPAATDEAEAQPKGKKGKIPRKKHTAANDQKSDNPEENPSDPSAHPAKPISNKADALTSVDADAPIADTQRNSTPTWKNPKVLIAAGIAVLLIIALCVIFLSRKSEPQPVVIENTAPAINYDSICMAYIEEGLNYERIADQYQSSVDSLEYDPAYPARPRVFEDYYIEALDAYARVIEGSYCDSISDYVLGQALEHAQYSEAQLDSAYQLLTEKSETMQSLYTKFKDNTIKEAADIFAERAAKVAARLGIPLAESTE